MPVNCTHPDYEANTPTWLRARDVVAGEEAIKAGGERYLPRLDAQTDSEYQAYKGRASFFNATARTVDGFVGLIFRRSGAPTLVGRRPRWSGRTRKFEDPSVGEAFCRMNPAFRCTSEILFIL